MEMEIQEEVKDEDFEISKSTKEEPQEQDEHVEKEEMVWNDTFDFKPEQTSGAKTVNVQG